jgi:hypothetical protein
MSGSEKEFKSAATKSPKKKFIVASIFWTHVRRIGVPRTFIGGGLMYLSFLEFIFIHLTSIIILYRWMIAPFFKAKKFAIRDFIILDRNKIAGMTRLDRINCEFCGYANGTATLWNYELDAISETDIGKGKLLRKLVVSIYAIFLAIFSVFNFILSKLLFSIIALFLGYQWASTKESRHRMRTTNYAGAYGPVMRTLIRFAKIYAETLSTNLEQIESSWCPLKHIETATSVVPDHHKNFYDREELGTVIKVLAEEGTVSPRKPRY